MYRFALSFDRNIRGKDPNINLDERRMRAEILAKAGCNLVWGECVTAIEHQRSGGQSIRIFLLINNLAIFPPGEISDLIQWPSQRSSLRFVANGIRANRL